MYVDTLLGYYEQGQYSWQLLDHPNGPTDALEPTVIIFHGYKEVWILHSMVWVQTCPEDTKLVLKTKTKSPPDGQKSVFHL